MCYCLQAVTGDAGSVEPFQFRGGVLLPQKACISHAKHVKGASGLARLLGVDASDAGQTSHTPIRHCSSPLLRCLAAAACRLDLVEWLLP